jgi:cobalt-zinc-cadmium efflux system outer membrane protein
MYRFRLPSSLCAAALLAGALSSVRADSPASPPIPVETLVQRILTTNPELRFYEAEIAIAQGDQTSAATWGNPQFSASVGEKRVRGGDPSGDGAAWSVAVMQPFDWPGRIPLRKAIANRQMKMAELGLAQFRAALATRTRVLAYSLAAARENAAAANEVAQRFETLRNVVVERDAAGLTPELEADIIEATALTERSHASEHANEAQAALFELNQISGQPWGSELSVALTPYHFNRAPALEALIASAREHNFELQMRIAELEQQGLKVSLARNERNPTVSIGPYFDQEKAGDRETHAGISLSLPLPLWDRSKGKISAEEARREQLAVSLEVTQRGIEREIATKAHLFATKVDEMSRWRPDSVERFKAAVELADRHYRMGAVPISTYVELQRQYLEALDVLFTTRRDALEAGQDLERLTGLDFQAVLP